VLYVLDYLIQVARIKWEISRWYSQKRGIMNLNEANSLPVVALSGFLILGAIGFLIFWALQTAYVG
jgi:hypothetical protein